MEPLPPEAPESGRSLDHHSLSKLVAKRAADDPVIGAKVRRIKETLSGMCPEIHEAFWAAAEKVSRPAAYAQSPLANSPAIPQASANQTVKRTRWLGPINIGIAAFLATVGLAVLRRQRKRLSSLKLFALVLLLTAGVNGLRMYYEIYGSP